jgi:hypothetical protein
VVPVRVTVAVATVRPVTVYVIVYAVPIVPSTPKPVNVANPEEAVAVVVPTNEPPAPEVIVAVTTSVDEVTVLLDASRIVI